MNISYLQLEGISMMVLAVKASWHLLCWCVKGPERSAAQAGSELKLLCWPQPGGGMDLYVQVVYGYVNGQGVAALSTAKRGSSSDNSRHFNSGVLMTSTLL